VIATLATLLPNIIEIGLRVSKFWQAKDVTFLRHCQSINQSILSTKGKNNH